MSKQIDWSKAPADATHYQAEAHGVFECWLKPGHAVRVSRSEPDWQEDEYADDLIATSAIKRPWSGEGLPPVGVVCEYNPMPVGKPKKWHKVEVVYASEWVIVMRCIEAPSGHEGGNGVEIAMAVDSCSLEDIRPIRTPEQIAADEREAQIVAIHDAIVTSVKVTLGQRDSWRQVAEMVYNAGFKR